MSGRWTPSRSWRCPTPHTQKQGADDSKKDFFQGVIFFFFFFSVLLFDNHYLGFCGLDGENSFGVFLTVKNSATLHTQKQDADDSKTENIEGMVIVFLVFLSVVFRQSLSRKFL